MASKKKLKPIPKNPYSRSYSKYDPPTASKAAWDATKKANSSKNKADHKSAYKLHAIASGARSYRAHEVGRSSPEARPIFEAGAKHDRYIGIHKKMMRSDRYQPPPNPASRRKRKSGQDSCHLGQNGKPGGHAGYGR